MQGFNRIGVQAFSGRVYHHHIRGDPLLFQLQAGLSCVTTEKLRIGDAIADSIFPGVPDGLLYHLNTDHFFCLPGHNEGDGSHATVQIQHQIIPRDVCLGNGSFIQPFRLGMIDLVKGFCRQSEGQTAKGIFNISGAIEQNLLIPQNRIALFGVNGEDKGHKARDFLQLFDQIFLVRQFSAVDRQTDQKLRGFPAPADKNMPYKPCMGGFVISRDVVAVQKIDDRIFNHIRLRKQDQTAFILHNFVGSCLEKACVSFAFMTAHRVNSLVSVACQGRGRQKRKAFYILTANAV